MKTYLERQEIESLEQAADNLRDRLLIRLLSRLGCRVSEALALTVTDIDLQQGTITIQHLKSRLKLACPECGARLGKAHVSMAAARAPSFLPMMMGVRPSLSLAA